jgi:uncharacterized membrane protein YphA (DoxX/SURF4 family)
MSLKIGKTPAPQKASTLSRPEVQLKIALAASMFTGLALSPNLWMMSGRLFPLSPVARFLGEIPFPSDPIMYGAMLATLAAIVIVARPARWIFLFTALAITMVLFDQSRCQPWFYQYVMMLIPVGLYAGGTYNPPDNPALNTCRLMMASVYFWSGLQKMHSEFHGLIFPWLTEPFARVLPHRLVAAVQPFGVIAPFVEVAIGIGLLTRRFRSYAIAGAIAMHAFILLAIGPFGQNWNRVVWPWNVAMAAFLIILFWRQPVSARDILWPRGLKYRMVVLVMFVAAPALSFFNLWDANLSHALYAGRRNNPTIFLTSAFADRLPKELLRCVYKSTRTGLIRLNLDEWSLAELGVPVYSEPRVYKNVARRLCFYEQAPSEMKLVILQSRILFSPDKEISYDCSTLTR